MFGFCNRRGVEKNSIEPRMVLRSHKRKLTEQEGIFNTNLVERQKKKKKKMESTLCDTSDCIVISDSESLTPDSDVNKLVTSTPIRENLQNEPNLNESRIIPTHNTQPDNNPIDVIVISDSSGTTLPVIVLSDEDESDVEITLDKNPKTSPCRSTVRNDENKNLEFVTDKINNKNFRASPKTNFQHKKIPVNRSKFRPKWRFGKYGADFRPGKHKPIKPKDQYNFGENIYIENPVVLPKTGLRPIIIDGSNVAFHHSNNTHFSCKGLEICIKYFKSRGHEVIAFVPHFRLKCNESDNPKLLDLLVKSGDVVLTPSRTVNGSLIVSYDDRFIVQTAVIKGGIIVTRDNYRDLLNENPLWAETIKYRLLQFTWVQDLLMFPNDPLGKRGPSLEEFLRFGYEEMNFLWKKYVKDERIPRGELLFPYPYKNQIPVLYVKEQALDSYGFIP